MNCGLCYNKLAPVFFLTMKRLTICDTCVQQTFIRCSYCGLIDKYAYKTNDNFYKNKTICKSCSVVKKNKDIPEHFCIICSYESEDPSDFASNYRICNVCASEKYKKTCSRCNETKYFIQFGTHNTKCLTCIYEIYIEQNDDKIINEKIRIEEYEIKLENEQSKDYPNDQKILTYEYEINDAKNSIKNLKEANKQYLKDIKHT